MTEPYKSLETKIRERQQQTIRERQQQTIRERMEEAALKRGKVETKDIEPAPEPIIEEVEPVDEISKEKLGRYVKDASIDLYDRGMDRMAHAITNPKDIKGKKAHTDKSRRREGFVAKAVDKLVYEPMKKEEVEPVEELMQAQSPLQQKMAQEKANLEKQKGQIKLQIAKEKAAKQEQIMKQKGQQELAKIKEDDLEERLMIHPTPNNFGRANRFSRLHQQAYQRLASQGELGRAELHRKRMIEWKRRAYMAHDNPQHLQR